MKKILITFITLAMLLSVLPSMAVSAESTTCGISGDCEWRLDGTVLTISGNGAMGDYNVGDEGGFVTAPWGRGITEIVIEDGVTYIGKFAFAFNQDLKKVTLPSSVQNIGKFAFSECEALETLICPNDIPAVQETGLTDSPIKELTFGKNVSSSDMIVAFGNNVKLEKINISADNSYFIFEDGVVFSKNKKELILYLDSNSGTLYTVPDGVEVIGAYAFDKCYTIKKVVIPNGVKTIGTAAFRYDDGLMEINIPGSVEAIGEEAFLGTNITSITIPDSVTSLGRGAFWYSSLGEITLGSGIKNINDLMFCWTPLKNIVIPYGVESIGSGAFVCPLLENINIPVSVTSIGEAAFYECAALTDVYYSGSEDAKNYIVIAESNEPLLNAMWHYSSCEESHVYSNVCDATCNVCGETREVLNHNYDSGQVTKAATCKATGVKTYTCSVCKGIKTETIAKLTTHTYSNNCDTICNVCGATRSITHKYDSGKVTKDATCKATGIRTYTCSVCKSTKTSTIAKLTTHSYKTTTAKATLSKNGSVVKKCTVCGRVASKSTIKYVKSLKLSTTTYTYNGKIKTPSVTVKDYSGKVLKQNTDYTVSYAKGRKNVGTYKVKIEMKGKYSGTKTLTFKINPAKTTVSKLTAGNKSITVAIKKKSSQVSGYQIQYSTSKKFTKAKTKTISSYKTTKYTLKSLSAKKTYYVRIRNYKTVGKTKYYSGWSTYKYVKTK